MSIHRNSFIESFAQNSPALNTIFLNHVGAPSKLLTDVPTIELLADKNAINNFIIFCTAHPLVKHIKVSSYYRFKNILVEFVDGSELHFCLLTNMIRKSFLCLNVSDIRKTATVNSFGMLVPELKYHIEYMALKTQFNKDPLSDRYKNYFSGFNFKERAVVFKYLQTRYNLIFNTIEDLYKPKPNIFLTILIGLRSEKENTLFKMFIRSIEITLYRLLSYVSKREKHIIPSLSQAPDFPGRNKNSARQAML